MSETKKIQRKSLENIFFTIQHKSLPRKLITFPRTYVDSSAKTFELKILFDSQRTLLIIRRSSSWTTILESAMKREYLVESAT